MKSPRFFLGLVVVMGAVLAARGTILAQAQPTLTSTYSTQPAPLEPLAAAWNSAPELRVPLTAQSGVVPALAQPTVNEVSVKSLHDGQRIAFLLTWADTTRDDHATRPDQFRDAAAVQLPVSEAVPVICMGAAGQLSNLWHWKADWQTDIDQGFQDVVEAYPNFWNDYYPFVVGQPPYHVPTDFSSADARAYFIGWAAGNPLSDPNRVTPVEDLSALGFGTVTHQKSQDVLGRGVWQNGKWQVVFSRPLASADSNDVQLAAGKASSVAFAVWNGSNQEVGARKQLSSWVTLQIQGGGAPAAIPVSQSQAGAAATTSSPAAAGAAVFTVLIALIGTLILVTLIIGVFGQAAYQGMRKLWKNKS
jgi:hypothetical protein